MEKKLFDEIRLGKDAAAQLAEMEKDGIPCSPEEQKALKRLARHGEEARNELVGRNEGLVKSIVRYLWADKGIEEDLLQAGRAALAKAMETYEPSHGAKFSTYAYSYVLRDVRRAIAELGYVVKLSEEAMDNLVKVTRGKNEIERETGREATVEEIATRTALPAKKVIKVLKDAPSIRFSTNFDIDTDEESGSVGLKERLAAPETCEPERALMDTEGYRMLHEGMDALPERERKVVTLLNGFEGGRALSLAEAAQYLGCSKTTVSNIRNQAYQKLRESLQDLRAA